MWFSFFFLQIFINLQLLIKIFSSIHYRFFQSKKFNHFLFYSKTLCIRISVHIRFFVCNYIPVLCMQLHSCTVSIFNCIPFFFINSLQFLGPYSFFHILIIRIRRKIFHSNLAYFFLILDVHYGLYNTCQKTHNENTL